MTEYLSDQEQIDQIKVWWKENGVFIFGGVLLGLIGIFSWRGYNSHLDKQAVTASQKFDELVKAVSADNFDMVTKYSSTLVSDYAATPYAAQAQLLAARVAVQKNDLDAAAKALYSAISLSNDTELSVLANFRLAKVQFAQGKLSEALDSLKNVKSENFTGIVHELRGDILAQQNKISDAQAAYEAARLAMEKTKVGDPNLLQMKLSDLGN